MTRDEAEKVATLIAQYRKYKLLARDFTDLKLGWSWSDCKKDDGYVLISERGAGFSEIWLKEVTNDQG